MGSNFCIYIYAKKMIMMRFHYRSGNKFRMFYGDVVGVPKKCKDVVEFIAGYLNVSPYLPQEHINVYGLVCYVVHAINNRTL